MPERDIACVGEQKRHRRRTWAATATTTTSTCSLNEENDREPTRMHIVKLNVGGRLFQTTLKSLKQIPYTRLAQLNEADPSYDFKEGHYFFDRSPELFDVVLDAYRHGRSHFPHTICCSAIREELTFWGVGEEYIAECCWRQFKGSQYDEETIARAEVYLKRLASMSCDKGDILLVTTKNYEWLGPINQPITILRMFTRTDQLNGQKMIRANEIVLQSNPTHERPAAEPVPPATTKWKRYQRAVWALLEDPSSSRAAKIWGLVFVCTVILSVAINSMQTHPLFRVQSSNFDFLVERYANITNTKLLFYLTTDALPILTLFDQTLTAFFSAELLTRFFISPNKCSFVKSIYNIFDLLAILPASIGFLMSSLIAAEERGSEYTNTIFVISFLSLFRILRLMKYARHFTGMKIVLLALRSSLAEMTLLFLLIGMMMLVFSSLIYYAEFYILDEGDFTNIPVGFWWAVVTMTTVGYGDLTPDSSLGYCVGALCTFAGMISTGLSIPLIANNFSVYYSFAKATKAVPKERISHIDHRRNTLKKLHGSPLDVFGNAKDRSSSCDEPRVSQDLGRAEEVELPSSAEVQAESAIPVEGLPSGNESTDMTLQNADRMHAAGVGVSFRAEKDTGLDYFHSNDTIANGHLRTSCQGRRAGRRWSLT